MQVEKGLFPFLDCGEFGKVTQRTHANTTTKKVTTRTKMCEKENKKEKQDQQEKKKKEKFHPPF